MNLQAQRDISRKLKVFEHVVAFTCEHFGISRDTFYQWKRAYAARGEKGLINSKHALRTPSYVLLLRMKRRFSICAVIIILVK